MPPTNHTIFLVGNLSVEVLRIPLTVLRLKFKVSQLAWLESSRTEQKWMSARGTRSNV